MEGRKMFEWRTCPICLREFPRRKKKGARLMSVRKIGAVTCSPKCSREYNTLVNFGKIMKHNNKLELSA